MKVELDYFRPSGKYYTSGDLEVDDTLPLHEIFTRVQYLHKQRELPGLVKTHSEDFIVHINVPEHPHNHPHLVL